MIFLPPPADFDEAYYGATDYLHPRSRVPNLLRSVAFD